MEYKDYSYYQEKFKEEEGKKSGAEIMLWIFGFIIISTIMINITENQLDISINGFLKFIPIIILTSAFFLRKRKFLVGLFLIISFGFYGRHIHKLSSPYSYLDIEIPDRGNSLDINNSILIQGSCTNFLSKEEGINCIDDLHQWLENHDDKVLMDSINILKEQFSNQIENVNDYTDKLNTYIEYANKIQRISPELALSYYEDGLEIAKKSNQQTFISIFYYYIVVENYLLNKYTAVQTIDELQKLYRVTSNPNLKQVANYTSLQIKKNTYSLTQDDYDKIMEYGRNGGEKDDLRAFKFLFKILQGDYLTQNVFFQLARNTYVEVLTQEIEVEDEIKGILGRYYERLGNAYYNKGAAERAVFFLNKKRELGELGLGVGDNVIDLFIPNIQCNQEKLSIEWEVQHDINSEKLLVNSMLLLHYFHDKITYKSNISKTTIFLEKALSNENIPPVIKREILYNLARYYNLEDNKKKAIKGLKTMNKYSNSYMEIADYHYQLSTYYYYELNLLDKAISHSDKCLTYYGTNYENIPRFTKDYSFESLFTPLDKREERFSNIFKNSKDVIVGYEEEEKGKLYRAPSTNQTILTSYERAMMHLNVSHQKNDIKELVKAYLYIDYAMRNIQDIWGCTSCESDKDELATLYFNIIDLYINLAHSMIMYVLTDDNIPVFEGIFNAIELMKSNVALQGINKNYMAFLADNSDLKLKIKDINLKILNLDKEIEKNTVNNTNINKLKHEKFKLFGQRESLMTEVASKYPQYFIESTLVVDDRYSNIMTLMNQLNPDECFINYYQSPTVNKLYALIISRDNVLIQDIPLFYEIELDLETKEGEKVKKTISELDADLGEKIGKKRLLDDIALLNSFLKNGNTKEDKKLNELLYTMNLNFLDRLIPPNTYKTLYISKHGVINAIPFNLLLDEKTNNHQYQDLPYLFKKYNITYIPSGFSFTALRGYKNNNQLKSKNQLLNIAPFNNTSDNSLKSSKVIYNFFNEKMPKHSISLINEKATTKNVKELLPKYNILNFSTHGVLDTMENMKSKLLLSPSGSSENKDLYLYELFTMQLNSKLTVLSACETNLGEMKGVGGINSFVNAFHYAGCPTVVGTSWRVNDKTTGELMKYFYEFLQEGKTVSESLRQAKLKYLSQKRRTAEYHPYYWGGFMVSGDGNMTFSFD